MAGALKGCVVSVVLIAAVYRHQFTKPQQMVLLAMADEVRKGMDVCWPSAATIGWKTGYSERQVRRIWKQLEQLHVLRRAGVSRLGTIRWRLRPDAAPVKPDPANQRPPAITMSAPDGSDDRTSPTTSPDMLAPAPDSMVSNEPRREPRRKPEQQWIDRDGTPGRDDLEAGRSVGPVAELGLEELRAARSAALDDYIRAQDRLGWAKRHSSASDQRRQQAVHDAASRRYLLLEAECRRRAGQLGAETTAQNALGAPGIGSQVSADLLH